ncbi:MAG TPA: hypothetical protein PKK00_12675 [Bacteroidales bacterium]|nr:hypothetical protein [Bacteroidales bacterium]HPS18097.1 hypothetical protein [Bacteroidales bacterium]
MPLSWNEIKERAIKFSKEWEKETSEDAEAKSFWDGFFEVFGISRRRVASFEKPVKRLDESTGYIDLLWKGNILVEHKSKGKDLDKAYKQALDYFPGLKENELPKYVLVSDFGNFRLYDLEENTEQEFEIKEFYKNVKLFGFIAGYTKQTYKEEDPVNVHAAELMGKLHDKIKEVGYEGHPLELYLVRLLFCLFADDTGIFEKDILREYIATRTSKDGSDLAAHISQLFYVLNTPKEKRLKNLEELLSQFPYVNGKLFEENLPPASFDSNMRKILLECCNLDWGKISPAVFGSLFQSVMNPVERRNLGAHYTSEKNILKVIKPLFLDSLYKEFESVKDNRNKLIKFHEKISSLRFLDPACGCGNFLIIAYRELRLLEIEIIKTLQKGQQVIDIENLVKLDIDKFFGIELEEFPSQIAQVAMWLMDHQMNMKVSEEFGEYFMRLPLRKSAAIINGNALQLDWRKIDNFYTLNVHTENTTIYKVSEPETHYDKVNVFTKNIEIVDVESKDKIPTRGLNFDYILGNPPFVGKQLQNTKQKADMEKVFEGVKGTGVLDYVTAWYYKAAQFIQNTNTKVAFVSTNSISQGEQVGILWNELFSRYKIKIHFAHRTFKWTNEARGKAAVHVVIIGFANYDTNEKYIYEYEDIKGEPHEVKVKNISPYLVEGNDIFVTTRTKPLCNVPEIIKGSESTDNGHLMLTLDEVNQIKEKYPQISEFIRPFIGGGDFINGNVRYCLWLKDAPLNEIRHIPFIQERIEKVKSFRLASTKLRTRHWASFPTLFSEDRQPSTEYLMFPKVSSEKRVYIPFAYVNPKFIINNTASFIPNAGFYLFGILESKMHMAWMSFVCGRMKSDFIYSNKIVYNNFPWPENPTDKQIKNVEEAAQKVLDTRKQFPESSLADLYDPLTMPPVLVKAHHALDKAVDICYRSQAFTSETKRIEFLFELYDKYTKEKAK